MPHDQLTSAPGGAFWVELSIARAAEPNRRQAARWYVTGRRPQLRNAAPWPATTVRRCAGQVLGKALPAAQIDANQLREQPAWNTRLGETEFMRCCGRQDYR